VRGLATFPQNIISGIDRIADGALIEQQQPMGDDCRRTRDGRAANLARREARTKFRLLNIYGDFGLALRRRQLRLDRAERQIVERLSLARHTVMIHGVGTVGGDLHLEHGAVAFAGNALDGDARESKFVRKSSVVDRKVNEVAQPMGRDFHVRRSLFAIRCSPPKPSEQPTTNSDQLLPKLLQKPYIALKK
jgi:hypothetical protein